MTVLVLKNAVTGERLAIFRDGRWKWLQQRDGLRTYVMNLPTPRGLIGPQAPDYIEAVQRAFKRSTMVTASVEPDRAA